MTTTVTMTMPMLTAMMLTKMAMAITITTTTTIMEYISRGKTFTSSLLKSMTIHVTDSLWRQVKQRFTHIIALSCAVRLIVVTHSAPPRSS